MYESMRSALKDAMKARDEVAVSALRSAMAALDNATAVEAALPAVEHEHIAGSAGRLGAAEMARDELSEAEARDVVAREIEERRVAARAYDGLGRPETAARLRAEADVLAAF